MKKRIIFVALIFAPVTAFAQPSGTLQSLIAVFGNIAGLLVSLLSVLAFVAFFYGLAIYILNIGNDEKKAEEGKPWMFWSIVALFVMVTIWGTIGLLQKTVGNTTGPGKIDIIIPKF